MWAFSILPLCRVWNHVINYITRTYTHYRETRKLTSIFFLKTYMQLFSNLFFESTRSNNSIWTLFYGVYDFKNNTLRVFSQKNICLTKWTLRMKQLHFLYENQNISWESFNLWRPCKFFECKLWWSFCAANGRMPMIYTIKTDHSCEVWLKFHHHIDMWKPDKDFSIFGSVGHFVQWNGTCKRNAHRGLAVITLVKFCHNPQQFDVWKPDKIFHFVLWRGTCRCKVVKWPPWNKDTRSLF